MNIRQVLSHANTRD